MAWIRSVFVAACIASVAGAACGADDSVSLLRRKDTGLRLLPGSSGETSLAKPDLSLRLRFDDRSWMFWNPNRYSEGSVPFAGSTANWYDYFNANRHTGEDPNRKGNPRWIEGR